MPRGVFIHTSQTVQPLVYIYTNESVGRWLYHTYRRGVFSVARLTTVGTWKGLRT